MAKTSTDVARKWAERSAAAEADWARGVEQTQVDVTARAADRREEWLRRVSESAQKWEKNLRAVSLADWKKMTLAKGRGVYANRVRNSQDKFQRFMQNWLIFQSSVADQLTKLPRGTLEQNIARSAYVIRASKAFSKDGSGVAPAP